MKIIPHSFGSDCEVLLADLTGKIKEISIEEKEKRIQSGVCYSEVISEEGSPTPDQIARFKEQLDHAKEMIALGMAIVAERIWKVKGANTVLVSLVRGGTPYGALVKRYLKFKYHVDIPHYGISIIRGKGIDEVALHYIQSQHPMGDIQFVDGWTGKGSIINELKKSVRAYNETATKPVDDALAVYADPAYVCDYYGTRRDLFIPSCELNATVGGLISRTINHPVFTSGESFHGSIELGRLAEWDMTREFLNEVSACFPDVVDLVQIYDAFHCSPNKDYAEQCLKEVMTRYKVKNRHHVKLSVAESYRVLQRRQAKCLIVRDHRSDQVYGLVALAKSKQIPIFEDEIGEYEAVAIIAE